MSRLSRHIRPARSTSTRRHADAVEQDATYDLALLFGAEPGRLTKLRIRELLRMEWTYRNDTAAGRTALFPRPDCAEALAVIVSSPALELRELIALGALYPSKFFHWAGRATSADLRRLVAAHDECPTPVLELLAADPDPEIAGIANVALGREVGRGHADGYWDEYFYGDE